MKIAIYCRVSTQDQNLDNQLMPLKQYCERMGYEYQVFSEKESTRKTRPVQWDLYNRLLRKEFDGLVIYKFDRWARSTKELVEHMENLISKNIMIYSYTENVDLSNSMGRAMLTIISAFAQLERDIIRERTLAGLNRATALGKIKGRHPRNCGCGKKSNGKVHNGFLKPLRENNILKSWKDERDGTIIDNIKEYCAKMDRIKKSIRKSAKSIPLQKKCEICNKKNNLERHHKDYNKHYAEFMTLCSKCHKTYEKQTPPVQPLVN